MRAESQAFWCPVAKRLPTMLVRPNREHQEMALKAAQW